MCEHCEPSKRTADNKDEQCLSAPGNPGQPGYRVRELVCSYRPARDPEGRIIRVPPERLQEPRLAVRVLAPLIGTQPVEVLGVACLSSRYQLLAWHVVSRGHRTGVAFSMADALLPACLVPGTIALIVVHNHPSGDPTPSVHDVALTRKVEVGAALLGFTLVDHLITGDEGRYYSFRESGLLPKTPQAGTE